MWKSCDSALHMMTQMSIVMSRFHHSPHWYRNHHSDDVYFPIHGTMWCIFCIVWAFALFALLKGIWRLVCLAIARRREAVEATVVECNSKRDLGSEVLLLHR